MKRSLMLLALFAIGMGICQAELGHQISEQNWTYQNVDALVIEQRIKDTAHEYKSIAEIPRVTFFDMALPANITEYQALDKNAIVMLVSLTHDSQELPLKSVYLAYQGSKIELKLILTKSTPVKDKTVQQVLGKYRQDYFYLIPIHLLLKESQLTIDWAINRAGFIVTKFPNPGGLPIDYQDPEAEKQIGNLNGDFLKEFLKREYTIALT